MDAPSREMILERYDIAVAALRRLQRLPVSEQRREPRLSGLSEAQILELLALTRKELDLGAILSLVAVSEAELRRDLLARSRRSRGDPIRAVAQAFSLDSHGRPRLEELVDFWRLEIGESGHGVGARYKALLKLRHWIAHGRAWSEQSGLPQDVDSTWEVIDTWYRRLRQVDGQFPRG